MTRRRRGAAWARPVAARSGCDLFALILLRHRRPAQRLCSVVMVSSDVLAVAFLGEERKEMKTLIAPPVLLTVIAVALYLII